MSVISFRGGFKGALLVAAVVLLAACGEDSDSSTTHALNDALSGSAGNAASRSAGNAAPTIRGKPATSVLAGRSYSFQPVASDPNGDTLKFSAASLPSWASFNAKTGRLTGKPSAADAGTMATIKISVSDGSATVSLASFKISVMAAGTGRATLSWAPPLENTDGSVLTDLASYRILFGRSPDELDQSVSIGNPSITSYVVEDLTDGDWYFAVVAVNSSGVWSELSNLASKTVG